MSLNTQFAFRRYHLKRGNYFILLFLTFTNFSFGQSTANYSFANLSNGSLVLDRNLNAIDLNTGATQLYGPNTNSFYTAVIQNLGFTFYFMGTPYTSFSANPDGQVRLGAFVISGETQNTANLTCPSGFALKLV